MNELAKPSALATLAARFNMEPMKLHNTLKQTVFKDCRSDEEFAALVIVANEYGLNPLTKELYAFPAKGGGIVPVVSVDGWINLMNSHPQFDGIEFEDAFTEGKPFSVTATVYRKDRTRPTRVTEYYSECSRNTDPWKTAPCRMLRHKALIQCVRVAFGFSGIHDEDEARSIAGRVIEAQPVPAQVPLFQEPTASPSTQSKADMKAQLLSAIEASGTTLPAFSAVCRENGIWRNDWENLTGQELADSLEKVAEIVQLTGEGAE